jgi:hypothetical protein
VARIVERGQFIAVEAILAVGQQVQDESCQRQQNQQAEVTVEDLRA